MRPIGLITTIAMVLLLAGCSASEGTTVARGAVREAAGVAGQSGRTDLKLTPEQVGDLAKEADVGEDDVRRIAPELQTQPIWMQSMNRLQTVYDETPADVRSNLVGLACDGLEGKIKSADELNANIRQRFVGLSEAEVPELFDDVSEFWADLYNAANSDDPDIRTAAALTCFTVEQTVG